MAHWSFDDCTAKDNSGNGHDGTINGNPQCIEGKKGKGFYFDGVDDYVSVPLTQDLKFNPNTQSFSLSGWVKPIKMNMFDSNMREIFKNSCGLHFMDTYTYILSNNGFEAKRNAYSAEGGSYTSEPFCEKDKWYLFSGVWKVDGNQITSNFYVDGVLHATKTLDAIPNGSYPWNDLFIGATRHNYGGRSEFSGDDLRIYNRALSADEVQALYSGSTTTPVVNNPAINSTVANNLDIQMSEMLMEDEQGNENRLSSELKFIGNDSDGLPQWELKHYEMLPKTGTVINQNIPRILSNYEISIPLIQSSVSKEVYWANLGYTGKPNSKFLWKLNEYGVSDVNSAIPTSLPSNGSTSTSIKGNDSAPTSDSFLFGVDLVGDVTSSNLPILFQLNRDLSLAEKALSVVEKGNFADASKIKAAKEAASLLKQVIKTAQDDINAGKVANISNGNINVSSSISRLVTGVQVIASVYNTYDILNKTINGKATAADKEKYIVNGTFSIFGLASIISTPAVASGVIMKYAGAVGLGYSALQLIAAWGEHVNGITVTGTIKDAVQSTLFGVQNLDNIARNISEGASKGKTWEEMKASEAIITAKKSTVNIGLRSIETLEKWNSDYNIIITNNISYANTAKALIVDTINMVNSEQYSLTTYQNLYNAGRQAYYAKQALEMLHEN